MKPFERNNAVDWVRLGLATTVCLQHLERLWYGYEKIPVSIDAVPAFLAISGFYVLQSFESSRDWLEFAWKRTLRIAPAFLIMLGLLALASGWDMVRGTLVIYATLGHLVPQHDVLINGRFAHMAANPVVWSLSCEEIAYAALAVLFAVGAYRRKWPILIAFIASLIAVPFINYYHHDMTGQNACIIPAFWGGSLVYLYRDSQWLRRMATTALCGALATCVLAHNWHPPLGPLVSWRGAACGLGFLVWAQSAKGFPRIPDLSYGIYIYHFALAQVFFALGVTFTPLSFLPSLLVFALASWYLIEKPCLKLRQYVTRLANCNLKPSAAAIGN